MGYEGSGGSNRSSASISYNSVTPLPCNCVKTLIKSCALAFHPIVRCASHVADLGTSYEEDAIQGTISVVLDLTNIVFECLLGDTLNLFGVLKTTISCLLDIDKNCSSARRLDNNSDVIENVIQATKPVDNFLKLMADIYEDDALYDYNRTWFESFKMVVSDNSPGGTLLTTDEENTVLETVGNEESKTVLNKFLIRWNNTAAAWENGTLPEIMDTNLVIPLNTLAPRIEQYLCDTNTAMQRGFDSIFDNFDQAESEYKTSEAQNERTAIDGGICAKVKVRVVQDLVYIGDRFNVRMEISNGEEGPLENITVELYIRQTYGLEPSNDKFYFGNPVLNDINDVDGTWQLEIYASGYAEWNMIPYSSAAPTDDTLYDVAGWLSYSVLGSNFSVLLLPDTIIVKPDPSLVVHCFLETDVRGDDPRTQNIVEPMVPFTLAVMVMNTGYGIARALKISSAQLEIIENENGLLTTFQIVGAQLGNNMFAPYLTVDFGDIHSFVTKTASWSLTSTLQSTFFNYSATFVNLNPLGDPRLSVLDEQIYHELIHLVRIDHLSNDDGLDDFLVNDIVDENDMPDTIFNSANLSDVYPVIVGNITTFTLLRDANQTFSNRYKVVHFTVVTNASSWFYVIYELNVTDLNIVNNANVLDVVRPDKRKLLVERNAWLTTHINNIFLIHLLDFMPQFSNDIFEISYNLTVGPKNRYAPTFTPSAYTASVSFNALLGTSVLTLNASDLDNDTYSFRLNDENYDQFSVENNTGEITVAKTFASAGTMTFVVVVQDTGIPSKSSSSVVQVTVIDLLSSTTNTSPSISSNNATSTKSSNATKNGTKTPAHVNLTSTASTLTTVYAAITNTTPSSNSVVVTEISSTYTPNSSTSIMSTTSMSTTSIMSTRLRNVGKVNKQLENSPSWVISTAVAAAVLVLLASYIILLCVLIM